MNPSPVTGHLRVYEEGTLIEVVSHYTKFKGQRVGGGDRGRCSGFSNASRMRLMILLNSLKVSALKNSKLVTLTYRRQHVQQKEDKKNFKAFRECLRRHFPNHSGIWKLEYQERGSPHYHLIIFERFIPHEWIAETWNRIAESGDPYHRKAGTRIETPRHAHSAAKYVTKYLGKVLPEENTPADGSVRMGRRHWGVLQRSKLPTSRTTVVSLESDKARAIIRRECARRSLGACGDARNRVYLFEPSNRDTRRYLSDLEREENSQINAISTTPISAG
jgi:hypothetical protein